MDKQLRHERILSCRYYRGEDKPPVDNKESMFWHYECGWASGQHDNWDTELEELRRLGLSEWLHNNDGTAPDFKCLLFNRYCHWIGLYGGTDDFLKWYDEYYVRPSLTNRQRRAKERRPKLIAQCRYYKGEKENPFEGTEDQMKWYYESCWVELLSDSYENAKPYRYEAGNKFDDIAEKYHMPRSLIGLFLNRYEHWCCMGEVNLEYFREWLLQSYLKIKE